MPRHRLPALLTSALTLWPAIASASDGAAHCAHPLVSLPCARTYSFIAIFYMIVLVPPLLTALLILKPQFATTRAWALSLLGMAPASFLAAMIGFTLGGASGLMSFPYDASPFFFFDLSAALIAALALVGYAVACVKLGGRRA